MSTPELVTVVVDDREVQIPKGTGLVETALAAGIEIPVFCYEPRLGAAVGACRMCLVEIEGNPKLQAGCTLSAQDGLVVRTAQTSAKAAEGQNATLEFILVNHPLDCPVCDKGGECPLQDLTFRYGPGRTRMTFSKLTADKPIPISPHIALDRERCILCYRCTRFSESVAEDGELVAVNRGVRTEIATFGEEPYRDRFSGNVIELCPVGALTSTEYRFEARPWEIQNVPSVCGLCPVGCNVDVTTREGKVKRVLSRNHPEVDRGWLCDKGRFAFPALRAKDRIVDPLRRVRRRGFEEVSWDDALDEAERLLRDADGSVHVVLSGSETNELAYALAKLAAALGGSVQVPDPDAQPLGRPLSELAGTGGVAEGDVPLDELAPVAELWAKEARRNGTHGGEPALRVPRTPNGIGINDAVARAGAGVRTSLQSPPALLIVSGDEAAADPAVRELAEDAQSVITLTMFQGLAVGWADLVLPGTSYLERDGSLTNM
ncbi:MAG TPA: 2Fe-2S iron-sulfur cluster-binding protein, partial [Gaiellaceae bacterium]|nr:2Fe-2S iron-sulfur cluster-binding protein [Gaiellaceae bacterium]